MIGRLDRYVALRFLAAYLVTLVVFLGLFLIMELFGSLDGILDAHDDLGTPSLLVTVLGLYGTGLPFMFAQVAPFITVTAAVVTVVRLRRANELVPMVAAGRSARRVLLPVFVIATVVSGGLVAAQEGLLPELADTNRRLRRTIKGRDASIIRKLPHLVDGAGVAFVCEGYDADERVLLGVRVPRYRARGREWRMEAERFEWRPGVEGRGWYPVDGRLTSMDESVRAGPGADVRDLGPDERIVTDLKPREIDILVASEDGLGIAAKELRRLIRRHPARIDLRLHLHGRRAFAAANLILLLIGLPFALRGTGRSTALGAGLCIVICASYFAMDTLIRDVSLRGELHPLVAAWTPVVLFLGLGSVLFDSTPT